MATTFGLYYADITCGRFHRGTFRTFASELLFEVILSADCVFHRDFKTPPRFFHSEVVSAIARFLDLQLTDLSTGSGDKPSKLQYEITQIIILCNVLLHGLVLCCNNRLCQRAQ